MADAARLFHSASLPAGISPGWRTIGENVALAGDLPAAQRGLEHSPPHLKHLLDSAFTQVGTGVATQGGRVYVVQDFVSR